MDHRSGDDWGPMRCDECRQEADSGAIVREGERVLRVCDECLPHVEERIARARLRRLARL